MPETYLVDTNIFLEIMLSQTRREDCKKLLALLRDGKAKGIVTDLSVHSIIVLMDKFKKLKELKIFLLSLTAYKGLYVYTTSIADEVKAVEAAEESELDIDDAIQYVAALSINADSIISFDKDFDNLKIPRREPAKIMEDAHTQT